MALLESLVGRGAAGLARREPAEAFDVVVVGFGGAGACAAIEAAEAGARVLVVERFEGGGATARSGGVVYAGSGTPTQSAAGVEDSRGAMADYLLDEVGDLVPEEALRGFCEASALNLSWLERLGVSFPARLCRDKTAFPPDDVGLYYSGNEKQRAALAPPVPRGHVPAGIGQRGHVLFAALRDAALSRGVEVRTHSRARRLLRSDAGRVEGLELLSLPAEPALRRAHRALFDLAFASRHAASALELLEERAGRSSTVVARGGVVIAAGGFAFNKEMLRRHAPAFAGCVPLGTPGDDGSGIRLGQEVGGATAEMDSCAACRFLYPPEAFVRGLLVDGAAERFCDESLYSATVSRAIARATGGKAWLVFDTEVARRVRAQLEAEERLRDRPLAQILSGELNALVYRKVTTLANLHVNRRRAATLESLARQCGLPATALDRTVAEHNARVRGGRPDPFGKPAEHLATLERPPYYAVRCDLSNPLFPSPTFTLGGLRTDPFDFAVLDERGAPIPGLYAAGRSAVGICSRSYVSGLSIADCIQSGRVAGFAASAHLTGGVPPVGLGRVGRPGGPSRAEDDEERRRPGEPGSRGGDER